MNVDRVESVSNLRLPAEPPSFVNPRRWPRTDEARKQVAEEILAMTNEVLARVEVDQRGAIKVFDRCFEIFFAERGS